MITKHTDYCIFCMTEREAEHHLLYGSRRQAADQDGISIPICNREHNMGKITERIHGNAMAEKLSKLSGQLAWELKETDEFLIEMGVDIEEYRKTRRERFRKRYGKSYL